MGIPISAAPFASTVHMGMASGETGPMTSSTVTPSLPASLSNWRARATSCLRTSDLG